MAGTNFSNPQGTGTVASDGFHGAPGAAGASPTNGPANLPFGSTTPSGQHTRVSTATGIVAHAGGGQASATLLGSDFNQVSTVATAADSVKLPAATVGLNIVVVNNTATAAQLFGSGTDTINAVAAATGVVLAAGKTAMLTCYAAGLWVGPIALA